MSQQNADSVPSVWREADFYGYEVQPGDFSCTLKAKALEVAQQRANENGHDVQVHGFLKVTGFKRLVAQVKPDQQNDGSSQERA